MLVPEPDGAAETDGCDVCVVLTVLVTVVVPETVEDVLIVVV